MVIIPIDNHLQDKTQNIELKCRNADTSSESSAESSTTEEYEDHQAEAGSIITKKTNENGFSIRDVDIDSCRKIIPSNSHINVENSSDVVIGSLTQFHGPVTIVQNGNSKKILNLGDGRFFTEEALNVFPCADTSPFSQANNPPINAPTSSDSNLLQFNGISNLWTSKRRCLIILAAIAVLLFVIALITTLTLNPLQAVHLKTEENPVDMVTLAPLGKHLQITRGQWGGRPILNNTRELKHPTRYVIISHTAGVWCKNFRTCSDAVQILQSLHVSEYGSPDIGYNFLIGGDANIYVGRGWDIRNFHTDNNIGISFIGNFVYDSLTPGMIEACQELLEEGVKIEKLATNYTLIGHYQTFATQSPGDNVMKVIKTWPHFADGDFLDL